jgi:hypothetical protein
MSKGGRPALEGVVRYQNGRINRIETERLGRALTKAIDNADNAPPSPKVSRERQLFNAICFKGGGLGMQHAGDGIGQLWLVGELDIPGFDDTKLLNAGRTWFRGREALLADTQARTANFERQDKGEGTGKLTKIEREYYRYQSFLKDADFEDAKTLTDLMEPLLDGSPQHWVARIVQTRVLSYFKLPVALLAGDDDYAKLAAAKRALVAMAGHEARIEMDVA